MFSEISLSSILKDEDPQWREKTIFTRFSLMKMMLSSLKISFYEQSSSSNFSEERLTRFAIAWPLSQHMTKKPLLWQEFLNASLSVIPRWFLVFDVFGLCASVKKNFYKKLRVKAWRYNTNLKYYIIWSYNTKWRCYRNVIL